MRSRRPPVGANADIAGGRRKASSSSIEPCAKVDVSERHKLLHKINSVNETFGSEECSEEAETHPVSVLKCGKRAACDWMRRFGRPRNIDACSLDASPKPGRCDHVEHPGIDDWMRRCHWRFGIATAAGLSSLKFGDEAAGNERCVQKPETRSFRPISSPSFWISQRKRFFSARFAPDTCM